MQSERNKTQKAVYGLILFISHSGKGKTIGGNQAMVIGAEVEGED